MSIMDAFKFNTGYTIDTSLPNIYPMTAASGLFVDNDVETIFKKILTDCIERTHGLNEYAENVLWDNCLFNEGGSGLISLIANAMTYKKDLFMVYTSGVLRAATASEQAQIKAEYKAQGSSTVGIYISFANYKKTDMVKIYSNMEYMVLNSLNKSMNLSTAIQLKMSKMRETVSAGDKAVIESQARQITEALQSGRDILIDKDDSIESSKPDMESVQNAIDFINAKKCFILDVPMSYITGQQTGGIGSSGENDMRAVERGLKPYFVSILKPVLKALFNIQVSFKSQDFRTMTSGLEALKTFALVDETLLSAEEKQTIIRKLFDVDAQ